MVGHGHESIFNGRLDNDMQRATVDMNMCSMNMLFTWETKNLCIVFRQWRITTFFSLVLSLIAIVLLVAGYECIREISRRVEQGYNEGGLGERPASDESSSLLGVGRDFRPAYTSRRGKMIKSALYAVQVFYSFFIMLLFMTYNGWVMLAVAVGAFVGNLAFGRNLSSTKTVACH